MYAQPVQPAYTQMQPNSIQPIPYHIEGQAFGQLYSAPEFKEADALRSKQAQNWKYPIYFGCCHMCVTLVSIIMFIWVAVVSGHLDFCPNKYPMNIAITTQAVHDWQTAPFTDIIVSNENCESIGMYPVFEKWWLGTKMGYYDKKGNIQPTDDESWMKIPAQPPVSQSELNGMWICGDRMAKSFEASVRPVDQKCPRGHPCSDKLSPQNTICVDDDIDCPVVDLFFLASDDVQPYIDNPEYTVLDYLPSIPGRGAISLAYTKTAVDSLPIMQTQISQFPCLDPLQMWQQDFAEYYKLEKDINVTTCTDPPFYGQTKFDTRYIANNDLESTTQVNEWVIQNASGVQETLNGLP